MCRALSEAFFKHVFLYCIQVAVASVEQLNTPLSGPLISSEACEHDCRSHGNVGLVEGTFQAMECEITFQVTYKHMVSFVCTAHPH